jgi:hypothetical protein
MGKAIASVRWRRVCGLCVLLWSIATYAAAQGSAGRIEGIVRDEQAGVLPGVAMTLRNQATGVTHTLTTEGDGRFVFAARWRAFESPLARRRPRSSSK